MDGMQTPPTSNSYSTNDPTDLSDAEWDYIKSLVPTPKSGQGKRGHPKWIGAPW
jgi:hypothetical protein